MSDTPDTSDTTEAPDRAAAFEAGKAAAQNRTLLYVLGGVTVLAGAIAIAMPVLGSLTAAFTIGWVLIASGCIGLFAAFRRRDAWNIAAAFGLALLSVVAGILFLLQPIAGLLALTTLIAAYFVATGILRIYYGAKSMGDGGGWLVGLGVLSLIVGLVLWFGLPFNAVWVPGVLLGVDLVFWGALQIAFASRAGRANDGSATD